MIYLMHVIWDIHSLHVIFNACYMRYSYWLYYIENKVGNVKMWYNCRT